jgi:hypothetical protein
MARTNADNPDLSFWVTGFKATTGSDFTCIDFEGSGFDVDRHNLAMIACFDLWAYLRLIDLIATVRELFFTISGLSNCHQFDLATT